LTTTVRSKTTPHTFQAACQSTTTPTFWRQVTESTTKPTTVICSIVAAMLTLHSRTEILLKQNQVSKINIFCSPLFFVESKLIKFRNVLFNSTFFWNRSQVSASRGHKVLRAASGHPDSNPLRASGLFQEACRSRASILQGLGQTHQKRAVKA